MIESQKILIVDDREENLFTLEKILRETGANVIKAMNGNEALAATLHHNFALAILDVHMPGMSGFELADHLRNDELTKTLPIIFLTATFADDENAFKGYESGAVDYIIKPYNPVILKGKVAAFLELARYRQRLEEMVQERTLRLQHVNRVLRKIRNINQLIVHEVDEARLIRDACKLLVEERGFDGAWIVVVDELERVVDIAHEGFGDGGEFFADCLQSGSVPLCCNESRRQMDLIISGDIETNCKDCPLRSGNCSGLAMVTVLEHEDALVEAYTALISHAELEALLQRARGLLLDRRYPEPQTGRPFPYPLV